METDEFFVEYSKICFLDHLWNRTSFLLTSTNNATCFLDHFSCYEADIRFNLCEITSEWNSNYDQDEYSQDEDSEDELNDGEEEAPENRFVGKTPQDLEDVLSSLERYCLDTNSDNLPLMYKIRSNFANAKSQATVYRQSRLNQSTHLLAKWNTIGARYLIRSLELYGSDRPDLGVIG